MNKKELEELIEQVYNKVISRYRIKIEDRVGPNTINENEVWIIAYSIRNALEILNKDKKIK